MEKTTKMENINKHSYRYLRNSAMGSRMRRKGRFWFKEVYEILKLCDYKVKVIKGIENKTIVWAIIPTKVAPSFWIFSCKKKKQAIEFTKKMDWKVINNYYKQNRNINENIIK